MKNKQRKTLVREEGWPLIDGWYWCPLPLLEKRIEDEEAALGFWRGNIGVGYEFNKWAVQQHFLERRLAHQCKDGKIRAASWAQIYRRVSGGISLYGNCAGCGETLSDGVKTIIILQEES